MVDDSSAVIKCNKQTQVVVGILITIQHSTYSTHFYPVKTKCQMCLKSKKIKKTIGGEFFIPYRNHDGEIIDWLSHTYSRVCLVIKKLSFQFYNHSSFYSYD